MSGAVPLRIAGYAALFDRVDGARDTIRPGAFARTLAQRREALPLFWQHSPARRIGWVEQAGEDARGLRVVARIDNPQDRAAKLLRELAGASTIGPMLIGMEKPVQIAPMTSTASELMTLAVLAAGGIAR